MLNTVDPNDLNLIITHPRPPRRRQSGISLVPFRPYVKSLTSVRQPFSYVNGYDSWKVTGKEEIFFRQPNARCIGTLLDDCQISDTIRWDIQGESTLVPMMCKYWIISKTFNCLVGLDPCLFFSSLVDGAVVERGKPHLVQDAAVQVFTAGRHLRSIVSAERQANERVSSRHRRQSWHDLPEYHSVPYHQYTRAVHSGSEISVQCDLDRSYSTGNQEMLLEMEEEEEMIEGLPSKERLRSSIEPSLPITGRVRVSTMTQTDEQLSRMFNFHLETNEILLSSLVDPCRRVANSTMGIADDSGCHRCTSTGDDYPPEWSRVSTSFLLSNRAVEEKEERSSPSPRFNSTDTDYQTSLIERYERTVRERELIAADDVLRRYRERLSSAGTQTNLSVREFLSFDLLCLKAREEALHSLDLVRRRFRFQFFSFIHSFIRRSHTDQQWIRRRTSIGRCPSSAAKK